MQADKVDLALLEMAKKQHSDRSNWLSHWEELARYFLPSRLGFLSTLSPGLERNPTIYTDAPSLARRGLSTNIATMLRPAGKRWMSAVPKKRSLLRNELVAMWLEIVSDVTYAAMYDKRSKMEANLAEADNDLVTLGSACVRIGWNVGYKHLTFKCFHLRDVAFFVDESGIVIGVAYFCEMPLSAIETMFGAAALSPKMQQALSESPPKLTDKFKISHVVMPNAAFDGFHWSDTNKPYLSNWYALDENFMLAKNGYWSMPYVTPRWDTSSGEAYGRSPAMIVLDSARLANEMARDLIDGGANAVRPPLGAWSNLLKGNAKLYSGGLTLFDNQGGMEKLPGQPIWPIETGQVPAEVYELYKAVLDDISAAFFRDILELPSARDADLTATEINARLDQYARQAAPVFSRVEADYNAQIVDRCFDLLQRNGAFPPPPDELAGEEIEFEYESPLKTLREKNDAYRIIEGLELIKSTAVGMPPEFGMAMADNFDPDTTARLLRAKLDLPGEILTPMEQMIQVREQRAQEAEQAKMAAMAKELAPAISAGSGALQQLAGEGGVLQDAGSAIPTAIANDAVASAVEEDGIAEGIFEELEA